MRNILLLTLAVFAVSCSKVNKVEIHWPDGTIKEEYFVLKEDTTARHGLYKRYTEEGKLLEESYFNAGQPDSVRRLYWPDGKVMIEENYSNGAYDGPYAAWFESGNKQEAGEYQDNLKVGIWKYFYNLEGSPLKEEIRYQDNIENGPFKEYHPNGKVAAIGTYRDEMEDSLLLVFDTTGYLIKRIMYDMGRPVQYEEFENPGLAGQPAE